MSRLIPTLSGIIGSLLLNTGSAEPQKTIKLELGSAVTLSELVVNTGEQHYSFKRSQRDGEQDLYRRCLDSDLEEAWVFVKYLNFGEWWHEAGENETEMKASLSMIGKHLTHPETIEEVCPYHFHPEKLNGKGFTSEIPSSIDILGAIKAAYFVKAVSPELLSKFGFKVVVSSGIYTLRLEYNVLKKRLDGIGEVIYSMDNEQLRKALKMPELDLLDNEGLKIALGMSEFDYSQSNRVNFPKLNYEFAQRYSGEAVKMGFVPK